MGGVWWVEGKGTRWRGRIRAVTRLVEVEKGVCAVGCWTF